MKPNIILILVMGGIILIMGASSHPTSKEPLTYENRIISELIGMPYSSIEIIDLIRLQ